MKKVFILLAILSIIAIHPIFAQEPSDTVKTAQSDTAKISKWKQYWRFSGAVGLKISQVQLINWSAGGNSSLTGVAFANLTLNYKRNRIAWDTNLDTDFGALYSSDLTSYPWRKSNDRLNFSTIVGYEISPPEKKSTWYAAANGTFRSQYTRGYDFPEDGSRVKISNWLSPSFTELSIGVNWKWTELITLYLSPFASLITSCTDSILRPSFSVPVDKTVFASLGMAFSAGIMYDGVKNLRILTGLQLYTPYTDKDQKFGHFNVDWNVMITYQFLKVLNVSLTTNLRYYPKILFPEAPFRRTQFQEMFGLGVAYSF